MNARLSASDEHMFSGQLLDRSQSFTFTLDGHKIPAFAGDSVLSAVLAAGVRAAGTHLGAELDLSEEFCPHVGDVRQRGGTAMPLPMPLPMARTPALPGARLLTLGNAVPNGPVSRLITAFRHRPSLGVDFDNGNNLPVLIAADADVSAIDTDTLVVGGGLAGMRAAIAAAEAGERVVLVEQRFYLGGDAELFGHRAGEDKPEELIAGLKDRLRQCDSIDIRLGARAFEAESGRVFVHSVDSQDGAYANRFDAITARRIVLATGCDDRLPVFPGNRLPGVNGLAASFHLARGYGVWPGARTVFAGGTNTLYRLAMLASDAGVSVLRIFDNRLEAHSRFIDFAKAYGLTLAAGTRLYAIHPVAKDQLLLDTGHSWDEDVAPERGALMANRVIVSDGWMPRLELWQQLGGELIWDDTRQLIAPAGTVEGVALAGSAAGYATSAACIMSGAAAIARLRGRKGKPVVDDVLPEVFESPDAPAVTHVPERAGLPAYFTRDTGLSVLPGYTAGTQRTAWPPWHALRTRERQAEPFAPDTLTFSLPKAEALIRLGSLAQHQFADVLAERMLTPVPLGAAMAVTANGDGQDPAVPEDGIADYLIGRFGPEAVFCRLGCDEGRSFEAGCLIYETTDIGQPVTAIGVVLGAKGKSPLALVAAPFAEAGRRIAVREISRTTPARVEGLVDAG